MEEIEEKRGKGTSTCFELNVSTLHVLVAILLLYVLQISDFGMSRDLQEGSYYIAHGGSIPIKWTAPEVLLDNKILKDELSLSLVKNKISIVHKICTSLKCHFKR